jgi:HD-like signal output (HDOD) protein
MPTLVQRVGEVCPQPAAAQRIMDLTAQDRPTVTQLVDVVAHDPAIAAEVLRIANSPAFGRSRRVMDLHQAVTTIGFANLRHMSGAMSMLAAFAGRQERSLDLHRGSVVSATLAQSLARHAQGVDGKTAFLAGLLCEIGTMACLAVDADGYLALWAVSGRAGENRAKLERLRYGATTMQIGGQLLFRNQLPAEVALAVETSPDTELSDCTPLQRIVMFARVAASLLALASGEKNPEVLLQEIPALAERFGLTVDRGHLVELCLEAAEAAEIPLRQELGLPAAVKQPESAQPAAVSLPSGVAASRPAASRPAASDHRKASRLTWVVPVIALAALAVGAAIMVLLR